MVSLHPPREFVNATFVGGGERFDFRYVLPLHNVIDAAQKVDFSGIYSSGSIEAIDLAGLRAVRSVALLHGQQDGQQLR